MFWVGFAANQPLAQGLTSSDFWPLVSIEEKKRVVLNYIYEMENKSNDYLSEFIGLKDSKLENIEIYNLLAGIQFRHFKCKINWSFC